MRYGRAHWFRPDELDDDQRAYYDQLLSGPRDPSSLTDELGRLYGAFNARLLDPPVGTAIQQLGAALRFGTELSDREREIVILEVARSERAEYEWAAHTKVARRVGMSEDEISALLDGSSSPSLSPSERSVRELARELIAERDLDDQTFTAAEAAIGPRKIFDVVSLIAHYQHTALAMRVWRVPLRESTARVFG
jgi:4-carboxymuconolactone decarboxylase